jgi:hypothetical protein
MRLKGDFCETHQSKTDSVTPDSGLALNADSASPYHGATTASCAVLATRVATVRT